MYSPFAPMLQVPAIDLSPCKLVTTRQREASSAVPLDKSSNKVSDGVDRAERRRNFTATPTHLLSTTCRRTAKSRIVLSGQKWGRAKSFRTHNENAIIGPLVWPHRSCKDWSQASCLPARASSAVFEGLITLSNSVSCDRAGVIFSG